MDGSVSPQQSVADGDIATQLGQTMLEMIEAKHGTAAALLFASRVTQPTKPGTAERAYSDKAWSLLTARLEKLAGEAA